MGRDTFEKVELNSVDSKLENDVFESKTEGKNEKLEVKTVQDLKKEDE